MDQTNKAKRLFTLFKCRCLCSTLPPEAVITEDTARRPDGTILTVKRDCVKLTKGAYPTTFPNQPKYLTKHIVPKRKSPSDRQILLEARDERVFQSWCENNLISSFEHFSSSFSTKIDSAQWISVKSEKICYIHSS